MKTYSQFARKGYDYVSTAYDQMCKTMDIIEILSQDEARDVRTQTQVEVLRRKCDAVLDELGSIERLLINHIDKGDRP